MSGTQSSEVAATEVRLIVADLYNWAMFYDDVATLSALDRDIVRSMESFVFISGRYEVYFHGCLVAANINQ